MGCVTICWIHRYSCRGFRAYSVNKHLYFSYLIALYISGGESDNSLNASGNMAAACPTPPDSPSMPTCPFFTGELDSTMELYGIKAAEGNPTNVSQSKVQRLFVAFLTVVTGLYCYGLELETTLALMALLVPVTSNSK